MSLILVNVPSDNYIVTIFEHIYFRFVEKESAISPEAEVRRFPHWKQMRVILWK